LPEPARSRYWGSRIRIRVNRRFLDFCRTLHIYLSMFGLLVMLLFGLTGFTVNHEDWFQATTPRVREQEIKTPVDKIAANDRLGIVEHLRGTLKISGAMTGFDDLDNRIFVGFKEPGQTWEVEIEKSSGVTRARQEMFNFIALINNLHRGRYSGTAWRWVIDISAGFIVVACGTGMVLWLVLPRRRILGALALALGIFGSVMIYWFLVPGPDAKLGDPASPNPESVRSRAD
jgi:hypothetical protein